MTATTVLFDLDATWLESAPGIIGSARQTVLRRLLDPTACRDAAATNAC